MSLLLTFPAILLMGWAAIVDSRQYTIPYISIIGVTVLGVMRGGGNLSISLVTGLILMMATVFWQHFRLKPLIGYGDIQLIIATLLWVDLECLPLYFITCGACGLILAYLRQGQTYFPLAPAIATAWIVSITF